MQVEPLYAQTLTFGYHDEWSIHNTASNVTFAEHDWQSNHYQLRYTLQ